MPVGYIVGRIDVLDPEKYKLYRQLAGAAIKAHGGKILSAGIRQDALEGVARAQNVILEFPSFEIACQYYHSLEYQRARVAREGAATIEMVALEGR